MKSIKSKAKKLDVIYKVNYYKTLSKNIGFFVDEDINNSFKCYYEEIEREKKEEDKEKLYTQLDYIEERLAWLDIKSNLLDKFLINILDSNKNINFDKHNIVNANAMNFTNFCIINKANIIREYLENEKSRYLEQKEKMLQSLNKIGKIYRLFKSKELKMKISFIEYENELISKIHEYLPKHNDRLFNFLFIGEELFKMFNIEESSIKKINLKDNEIPYIKSDLDYEKNTVVEKIKLMEEAYFEYYWGKNINNNDVAKYYELCKSEIISSLLQLDFDCDKEKIIGEITEKSNTLKSLREQTSSLEKQNDTDNRDVWNRIE